MEEEVSSEEMEEATPEEEYALRACESVEATAAEVDALVRQDDEAVTSVEHSRTLMCVSFGIFGRGKRGVGTSARCEVHVGAVCLQRVAAPAFRQA
jgi:hypothetical protein